MLAVVLVTAGVRCGGHDVPVAPARAGAPAAGGGADEDERRPGKADEDERRPGKADEDERRPGKADEDERTAGKADADERRPGKKASEPRKPPPRPLPRSPATTLRVPSLGIVAPIVPLRLGPDRHLGTPPLDRPKLVGWYAGGPTPGERGTAVAVGHRDTKTGPAVFAGLARVARGARIEARRADGRTAVYTVDRVRVFDKATFPDKEVYGPTRRPELRVLTCGGLFRHATGYTSNVVVFAHLTATR